MSGPGSPLRASASARGRATTGSAASRGAPPGISLSDRSVISSRVSLLTSKYHGPTRTIHLWNIRFTADSDRETGRPECTAPPVAA